VSKINSKACLPTLALAGLMTGPALASDRVFTYVYDVTTQPVGAVEFEQWVTWKTDKDTDSSFDRIDLRSELEFGLTEDLQLGLYLADVRYEDGASVSDDGVQFHDVAAELIYNLSNPTTDPIGAALLGEVKFGGEVFALEAGILLQKNIDRWVFAYNAILEAEWESAHYNEDIGVFEQSAGVSYQFSPKWSAGAELLHEVEFDDWSTTGHNVVYVGPNAAYRGNGWWVSVTQMFQATNVAGESNYQTRLILGIDF